ncbi:MAG: hypothetical protein ACI9G1_005237 [Pirellulaceae bacterium]|jgi:hypothetical protein
MPKLTRRLWLGLATSAVTSTYVNQLSANEKNSSEAVYEIASRRELFVDETIVGHLARAELRLHPPQPREKVLTFDRPWEGLYCGYETVIQDGDLLRMYYRGLPESRHTLDTEVTCVAESKDGVHWTRPDVGAYEVQGTKKNNVVLARNRGCHNFAPFIDANPNVPAAQRYKALGGTGRPGLLAFVSADGLHWKQIQQEPVITDGAFDSQNNAFWSASEQQYVCYFRVFRENKRWIARTTSKDFIHWTAPVDLELGQNPRQHLYTNQFDAYFRAPHIYLGMPTRYFPGRRVVTDAEAAEIKTPKDWNYVNDCTDIVLTSARGGASFHRTHMEAFVRPGLDLRNWTSRANYAVRGVVQTGPHELSFFVKHNSGYSSIHVQRYTLRLDGFASLHAGFRGGTMTTKLLAFTGRHLVLNYATSAAGGLRVELRDADNKPLPGYSLADCREIIGDRIDRPVTWKGGGDVSTLAGKPVRVHFELRDADLYSIKFD